MKTYTKCTEEPRLKIMHDDSPESPREWDNLGYFITVERNHGCPDNNQELEDIVRDTQYEAKNTEDHMKLIKKAMAEDVIYITPVFRYEHGNVLYKRGIGSGFDSSNCGFYIVTKQTADILGTPKKLFEKVIDGELETYTKWCNGEVYGYTLAPADGEDDEEDSCWGFYDIEDIRDALPDEWKDEDLTQYLV